MRGAVGPGKGCRMSFAFGEVVKDVGRSRRVFLVQGRQSSTKVSLKGKCPMYAWRSIGDESLCLRLT